MLDKLLELAHKRISTFIEGDKNNFYKGSQTFVDKIHEEMQEAIDEIKDDNHVHLEDELGDVLWVYICLLESLKAEGKITSIEKVIERSYEKFSERICPQTGKDNGIWEEIKKVQKKKLKEEQQARINFEKS